MPAWSGRGCRCRRARAGVAGGGGAPGAAVAGRSDARSAGGRGLAAIFAGCVMLIAAHTYNPFIYFRF